MIRYPSSSSRVAHSVTATLSEPIGSATHRLPGAESAAKAPRPTYISWAPHCSRSDHTARELGGRRRWSTGARQHRATVWLKYLVQARARAGCCRRSGRRRVRHVAAGVCGRVRLAGDLPARALRHRRAHRGVPAPALEMLPWLHARCAAGRRRRSSTNEHLARCVRAAGGHATIVPDVPVSIPGNGHVPADGRLQGRRRVLVQL